MHRETACSSFLTPMAETASISPEMAARLGKFCGNGPDLWLSMQAAYDLWHVEKQMKAELAKIPVAARKAAGEA